MSRITSLRAELALLGVAAAWGLTFPLIRAALADVDAPSFLMARFGVAAAAFALLLLFNPRARAGLPGALGPGLLLAAVAFASYLSQTLGLTTVGAGRAAFVTGTYVVLVPLLGPLFGAGRPRTIDLGAVAVAALGLWLLTDPGGGGVTRGDLWVLGCALAYAVYLHLLQRALQRGTQVTALAFVQVAGLALFSPLALPFGHGNDGRWGAAVWTAVLFCALVATVGTFWTQTRFQGETRPERAALLLSTEPVFAALFAWWLADEALGPRALGGAALILAAVVGVEVAAARLQAGRSDPTSAPGT